MATQNNNLHDVFDEIINSGGNGGGTAIATEPKRMAPTGKESTKLTAPGTAPVGPRRAGANACQSGRADKSHMLTNNRRTSLKGSFLTQATLSEVGIDTDTKDQLKISDLVLTGLRFLSPVPLRPGTIKQLRTTGGDDAKLSSAIRVVSTKVRADGQFDVSAEFY
jgi:hypothetical protein